RRKGRSVVGADAFRQAVLSKQVLEAAAVPGDLHALHRMAVEEEPGVAVLHGNRVAKRAVAGAKLPLEVGHVSFGASMEVSGRPGRVCLRRGFFGTTSSCVSSTRWMVSTDGTWSNSSRRMRWILGAPQPR